MSNIITATISASLAPVTVAPVSTGDAHLVTAQQLMNGARVLAGAPHCELTLAFVCAHVTECLLKAFLFWKGVADKDLQDHNLRHDLCGLRALAVTKGLAVDPTPPVWLSVLSALHNRPFHLRYPVGLHAHQLPGPQPMLSELELLEQLAASSKS